MNENLCTIYVVRHGESFVNILEQSNLEFDANMEVNVDLTPLGIKQVKDLAEKFKDIEFAAIYSSDYLRAKETAKILKLQRNLEVLVTEVIRERQFGSWQGRWHLVKMEIQEKLKELAEEEKMKYKFEDVETEEHMYERFITFLREVSVAYPGKNVLVVSHGNFMRTILWKLGWAKYHQLPSKSIENTGYYVLQSDGVDFFIKETVGVTKKQI
jgi:broad specificity phosphatase PhoE